MSELHSIALKKRWLRVSPADRQRIAQANAKKKWAKMTPEQQKKHIEKMVRGRASLKK